MCCLVAKYLQTPQKCDGQEYSGFFLPNLKENAAEPSCKIKTLCCSNKPRHMYQQGPYHIDGWLLSEERILTNSTLPPSGCIDKNH